MFAEEVEDMVVEVVEVDAEEEETLLGGAVHEDGDFQDDGREAQAVRDSSSSVRYTESHCGAFHSTQSAEVGLVA